MLTPREIKRDAIQKWKDILVVVPKETRHSILVLMGAKCAFCDEFHNMRGDFWSACHPCDLCPVLKAPCKSPRWHDFLARIEFARYWRKIAVEFCEEVIKELKLVKTG